MAPYTIDDIAFNPPTATRHFMGIAFRVPSSESVGTNPIHPATGLQLSFRAADDTEMFLERMAPREVAADESGACSVRVAEGDIPRFSRPDRTEVDVILHAWKGEKHLGSWEVGKFSRE